MIIIIAALTQFTATFAGTMVHIALPDIYNEFHLSVEMLNWISIAFLTVFMAITIPMGKIISQFGLKKFSIINNIILIVGCILSMLSCDVYMLIFSRVIQAFAVSGLSISVFMMVVHEIPEKDVGQALGLVGSAGYIGLSSSPSLAGFIVYYTSWRYTFLFIVILCIIQCLMLLRVKKEWFGEKESIDYVGSVVYVILMIIFTIGLIKITKYGIYLLVISALLLAVLIKIEKSKENPIINFSLLNNLKYGIGTFAAMTMYFITFIATYILNLYLQLHLGFDQRTAGLILLITLLVMIFVSPLAGKLTVKYDCRALSAIALTVLLITMIILFSMANIPFYVIIIAIVLQGIGHGLFSAPNNKYTLTLVDKDNLGDATSILATSKEFGKNLSLAVYTVVCAIFAVNYHDLPTFSLSFDVIFLISISLTALAI